MIVTELYNGQGFGNQLWVYAVTRIIADYKKCDFSILSKNQFKGKNFMNLDFGINIEGYVSNDNPCSALPNGIVNYYTEKKEVLKGTSIDISRTDDKLFDIPLQTKIDGVLQSTKYLIGKKDNLTKWFKAKEGFNINADDDLCVIHLRCGDFSWQKEVFLPVSYYKNAINIIKEQNSNVKFYCVTDQLDVAKNFFKEIEDIEFSLDSEKDKYMASHHFGAPIERDFVSIMNAKYVIIPNSSFSWWAAYLNTYAKTIIAPKYWARFNISNGYWSTSDIITDNFLYLDRDGKIFNSAQCWEEKNCFEKNNEGLFTSV